MQRHHLRTLAALYAHPLQHGVRVSKVEALLRALGAEVSELDGRRLKIVMPGGQETWIRLGCGIQSPDLDSEAMLRVRHLLQEAGVTGEHPELLDRIVGIDSLSMAHPSEAQILANAREHFGNFAPRRPVLAPGQEYKPLGPLA